MTTYQNRSDIPVHETWNLADLFASKEAWEQAYKEVEKGIESLSRYNDAIENGKDLFDFLTQKEELSQTFNLVYVYAMLGVDLDTRDSDAQALLDRATQLSVKYSAAVSFFTPYLLSVEEETLRQYIKEVEGLQYFENDLYETYRYKEHVLNKDQEELLSHLGEALSSPKQTFGMMNNADIKFGDVTNDDGENVELTRGLYAKLIEDDDRNKRQEAYKAYYKPYAQLKNSIASTLSSTVKTNATTAKLRHFPSALEKALFGDNVPKEVYENLIKAARHHLPSLHTYSDIRKQVLGVEDLRQYDLSVKLVQNLNKEIPYDEAYETMLKALAPLGDDYVKTLAGFKEKRYVDVRETKGKRSGAYNLGVYGVHPFVLLNHRDNIDSLFTLSHEMGHAMHSYYSSKYQPQISARYSIFVAEVASTVNEILLMNYLINHAEDEETKLYLLNEFIDKFKGTFFTQVMFAEFEKKTHELAEQGQPLNATVFSSVYEQLVVDYHGPSLVLDDEVKYGWSRIPHFYRPFYVYKYATGFASAIHIANELLVGNKDAQSAYLEFLQSGGSDYPLELLKKAGVDLTTTEPVDNALRKFDQLVSDLQNAFSKPKG